MGDGKLPRNYTQMMTWGGGWDDEETENKTPMKSTHQASDQKYELWKSQCFRKRRECYGDEETQGLAQ